MKRNREGDNILQLFAHDIEHPKVVDFFAQHQLKYIEYSGERGQFAYQNPDKTLVLTFWGCSASSFRKFHMRPVIDRHGNKVEQWEDGGEVFTEIQFNSGFKDRLPFNLSFDMDEAAIAQTLQTAPVEIKPPFSPNSDSIDFSATHIKYHRYPCMLDVAYKNDRVCRYEIALTNNWQVEQFNLQAQYSGYQEPDVEELAQRAWAKALLEERLAHPAYHRALDASGLACPMPLLKAKLELAQLNAGEVLKVTATDAASQRDFRSFARLAGHALLFETQADGAWHYWLRKG